MCNCFLCFFFFSLYTYINSFYWSAYISSKYLSKLLLQSLLEFWNLFHFTMVLFFLVKFFYRCLVVNSFDFLCIDITDLVSIITIIFCDDIRSIMIYTIVLFIHKMCIRDSPGCTGNIDNATDSSSDVDLCLSLIHI